MKRTLLTLTALALATALMPVAASADYDYQRNGAIDVEIWTEDDRGDGYYHSGEHVRAYVRPTHDAYVVVYGADVHGVMHLLYPFDEYAPRRLNAGDTIELDGPFFEVGNGDGIVYVEALVSQYPIEARLPAYLYKSRVVQATYRWDYAGVRVSPYGVIIGDPHLALADFRRGLVPAGCAPYARAHATLSFRVGHRRHYPRYVCADCHMGSWYDPYGDSCSVFEIRIDALWSDTRYWTRCEPRYYYRKRPVAPYRYRSYKTTWSGRDGCDLLTRTFSAKSPREKRYLQDKGRQDLVSSRPGRTVDRPVRDRDVRADRPTQVRKPTARDRDDSRTSVTKPPRGRERVNPPRITTKRDRAGERPAKKDKPKIERQRKRTERPEAADRTKRDEVRERKDSEKRRDADRKPPGKRDSSSKKKSEKKSEKKKDTKKAPERSARERSPRERGSR